MNQAELRTMLCAAPRPEAIAQWLRRQYFPEVIAHFNACGSRKRFGLYQGEKIPANERNLTDVRTRMGLLIEFELARISNELLLENGIQDIFWSYVVANRFPDLEIRKSGGDRLLRLEIKCLQCVAEEKSANFDTLIKDIDPRTDFVVVCLWDWDNAPSEEDGWDAVPKIYKIYVFHAYSLASLRDTYWLNRPPRNLGDGFQGFDIRFAVTCANGVYSKEQGNYGKLTRIWKSGFPYRPAQSAALLDTEGEYIGFQKEIIDTGFEILAVNQLKELGAVHVEEIWENGIRMGFRGGHIAYVQTSALSTRAIEGFARRNGLSIVVSMNDKYKSSIFLIGRETSRLLDNGKPKKVICALREAEGVNPL